MASDFAACRPKSLFSALGDIKSLRLGQLHIGHYFTNRSLLLTERTRRYWRERGVPLYTEGRLAAHQNQAQHLNAAAITWAVGRGHVSSMENRWGTINLGARARAGGA